LRTRHPAYKILAVTFTNQGCQRDEGAVKVMLDGTPPDECTIGLPLVRGLAAQALRSEIGLLPILPL
jgi:hypothetical protein